MANVRVLGDLMRLDSVDPKDMSVNSPSNFHDV